MEEAQQEEPAREAAHHLRPFGPVKKRIVKQMDFLQIQRGPNRHVYRFISRMLPCRCACVREGVYMVFFNFFLFKSSIEQDAVEHRSRALGLKVLQQLVDVVVQVVAARQLQKQRHPKRSTLET